MLYDTDRTPYAGRQLLLATSADGVRFTQATLPISTHSDGAFITWPNFADTNTALVWRSRQGQWAVYGREDNDTGVQCPHGGSHDPARWTNFRRISVVLAPRLGSSVQNGSTSLANFNFSAPPTPVFRAAPSDGPCVDVYNPAAVEYAGVTFLFPSFTRHLLNPNATEFPNPTTTCRGCAFVTINIIL